MFACVITHSKRRSWCNFTFMLMQQKLSCFRYIFMIGSPRMLDDSALPYVTTLHQDLQRLMNGYADVGTKDDGAGSNETFIMMVMDGNVQGVSVFLETPHLHDDALSVTSDGYDCIMLAVLMGDVELLDVILRAISRAHSSMSRDSPELAKLYANAVHGSNVNMRHFPPLLRLPLRVNIAGQSALHIAVVWQDVACVQLLLQCVLPHATCGYHALCLTISVQVQTPWLGRGNSAARLPPPHPTSVCCYEQPAAARSCRRRCGGQ